MLCCKVYRVKGYLGVWCCISAGYLFSTRMLTGLVVLAELLSVVMTLLPISFGACEG